MNRRDSKLARVPNSFVRAATQVSQVISRADIQGAPGTEGSAARDDSDPFAPEPTVSRVMALLDDLPNSWPTSPEPAARPPQPPGAASVSFREPTGNPAAAPLHAPAAPVPAPPRRPTAPHVATANQATNAPAAALSTAQRGRVVALFGCRGGCGATTLTVNLAAEIARTGKRVCVVDLDLQLGDVFVALDLDATTSIAGLARQLRDSEEPWDESGLRRRLVRHDSGLYALTQTGRLDDIDAELAENLPGLLEQLAMHFDYVIVDGVRDFGDFSLAVLDAADDVALVVTQDVAAVRRAARVLSLFRTLGYDENRLRLVLNRFNRRAAIDIDEVERALAMKVHARIANDYKRVRRAFDDGAIVGDVAKTSRVANDLRRLTRSLQVDEREQEAPSRSWLPWRRGTTQCV